MYEVYLMLLYCVNYCHDITIFELSLKIAEYHVQKRKLVLFVNSFMLNYCVSRTVDESTTMYCLFKYSSINVYFKVINDILYLLITIYKRVI